MSIERAIEKAKQRLREQARRRDVEGKSPALAGPSVELATATASQESFPAPPQGFPALARLTLDREVCELNRVVVSGSGGELAKAEPAYRVLRSRVRHRAVTGHWSSFGITSPGPGEGKTLTTLNIALSIAREQLRPVVLIDLDMRNPSVFRYIGARPPVQLSSFLAGEVDPGEVLFSTDPGNLVVGGNHESVPGASELLATDKLKALLVHIRHRLPGAIVAVDLPPVTATDEAILVAPQLDAILLVVGEGRTRRDALPKALNLLSDFTIAGVVLNLASEKLSNYDYGRY